MKSIEQSVTPPSQDVCAARQVAYPAALAIDEMQEVAARGKE